MAKKPTGSKPTSTPSKPEIEGADSKPASRSKSESSLPSDAGKAKVASGSADPAKVGVSATVASSPVIKKTAARKTAAGQAALDVAGGASRPRRSDGASRVEARETLETSPDAPVPDASAWTSKPDTGVKALGAAEPSSDPLAAFAPNLASPAVLVAATPAPEVTPEVAVESTVSVNAPPLDSSAPASIEAFPPESAEPVSEPPVSAPECLPAPSPEPQPMPFLEAEPAAPPVPWRPSLFIVHITPELATVAKVGGLADVVFGLTRELAIRGNHVEIILPKYASMRYDQIYDLQEVYKDLWVPWYEGAIHCTVFFGFVHGRKCFFIEPHSHDNFFNRHAIYCFRDDVMRYAFFSRAAIEFLWKAGKHPDVIHCHDWQTALVPVHLYEQYQGLGMTHPRVCLTIHNFAHQGVTGPELLRASGLHRPDYFLAHVRLGDNRHPNAINLLKGGIVYSNFVTTVSPRYAFETKDQGQGFGLEPTLHTHHIKYGGVVNGIDYDVWNPEIDHHIPVQYGIDSLDRKYDNKRALRHRLMLADNEKAIVAFIGRLDPQKGLELVRHAIFNTLERGAQFVLLGSSPDERINADFWGLKRMLNDSPDCHLEIGFDEDLSHLIYAGADMMLVPSRFEPCGLTQLISLRYGTIPVVRSVGGLADTVFDKDHSNRPLHERNGYVFNDYDNAGLESALGRAIACYNGFPEHFRELMKNAMRCDYSWNRPGQDYLNIYDYIRHT